MNSARDGGSPPAVIDTLVIDTVVRTGIRSGFRLGFTSAFRGIGRVAARPGWWGIALAPALVGAAAIVAAFTPLSRGAYEAVEGWIGVPPDGALRTVYEWFFGATVVVVALALLVFVYAPLVRTISSPFLAILADRAVADASGMPTPPAPGSRVVRWILRPLGEALLVLAIRLVWMAVTSPLLCVPVAGPFLWAAVLLPLEGFDLLDIAVSARGKVFAERLALARANGRATIGLGLARTLILLVPCLNIFLLPGTVVGAVLLDQAISDDFPGGRRPGGGGGAPAGTVPDRTARGGTTGGGTAPDGGTAALGGTVGGATTVGRTASGGGTAAAGGTSPGVTSPGETAPGGGRADGAPSAPPGQS